MHTQARGRVGGRGGRTQILVVWSKEPVMILSPSLLKQRLTCAQRLISFV